ncbi:MAG: ATP-dependent helicase [Muribaculum sp.]|nr:ATP-dependent helicase [Muribaculum sp.]
MGEELKLIMQHVHDNHHFLLSGGAGSGKTYTLVQTIKQIISEHPTALIACITYTNAAVQEIENRVNHDNLRVSTIHDFLWSCICNFQNELRESIIDLINKEQLPKVSNLDTPVDSSFFIKDENPLPIQYKEYSKIKEGIISHDEVIVISNYMFAKYPKLCHIVTGSYPFILIDEYQDTNPLVVEIFLDYFDKHSNRKYCVGFFGDSMQAIYDDGIGDLDKYKYPAGHVYEVKKEQNRRSPKVVIDLANRIRLDGLKQHPSEDKTAPNMTDGQIKTGGALFLYTNMDYVPINCVRNYLIKNNGWNFDDIQTTKELNLTHNLISQKAGFHTLMEIHREDPIMKYRNRVNSFVKTHNIITEGYTFSQLISVLEHRFTDEKVRKQFSPTRAMQPFIESHKDLFASALSLNFDDFVNMYVNSDQLIDDKKQAEDENNRKGSKRSALIRHLMKIERCIHLYSRGDISAFLQVTEKKIRTLSDKQVIHEAINRLTNIGEKNVQEIIDLADELEIVKKDDSLERYSIGCSYVYDRVMQVPYREVQELYKYLEGLTPFSTQHKTKGSEFDNVLVILDNGNWNNYNFEKLFTATSEDLFTSAVRRSFKIFYVCCTRTKENLAVFYHKPSEAVLEKAIEWFGADNVVAIE